MSLLNLIQNQTLEVLYEKIFLKNFGTFTEKGLQQRCFAVNVVAFLGIPILKNICERLFQFIYIQCSLIGYSTTISI